MADTGVLHGLGDQHYGCIMISEAQLTRGDTPPDAATTGTCMSYSYDVGDDSRISIAMPDDWYPGTAMYCAIRWACNENYALASGLINWQLVYETVSNAGQVIGAGTSTTLTSGNLQIPTTALQTANTVLTMAAANLAVGDLINVDIERIANTGAPQPPTADALILFVRILYTRKFPSFFLTA